MPFSPCRPVKHSPSLLFTSLGENKGRVSGCLACIIQMCIRKMEGTVHHQILTNTSTTVPWDAQRLMSGMDVIRCSLALRLARFGTWDWTVMLASMNISMHNQMKTTVINFFPSIKFERNAKSGCMSTVSGFVFKLCRQCNQERADPELTTFVKNGQLMTSARLDAATTTVRINHWFYFQSHLKY